MYTQFLKNISVFSKIFKNSTLLLTVVSVGLLIMLLISGNLKSNQEIMWSDTEFECEVTSAEDVEILPIEQLKTNFENSSIDSKELVITAQSKNTIPQIVNPKFSKPNELEKCLASSDIVMLVNYQNITRIYPIKILQQHLIVNDNFADKAVLISYSILSGSPRAYISEINDTKIKFGNTGTLFRNNDLFYDYETESLWRQFDGKAIAGELQNKQLEEIPIQLISFTKALSDYPDTEMLNFDTGYQRDYSDEISFKAYEFDNKILAPIKNPDTSLSPKTKVLGIIYEDKYYAVNIDSFIGTINAKYATQDLTIELISEAGIIKALLNDEFVNYRFSYWFVWKDFYPETILLNQ